MAQNPRHREETIERLAAVFRAHGYAGTSLAAISEATGLGKGSLYNAFPGGKAEMAEAVLAAEAARFKRAVLAPLARGDPAAGIAAMAEGLERHYAGGRRDCLFLTFARHDAEGVFSKPVRAHFVRWHGALAQCLTRGGVAPARAETAAGEAVIALSGALTLAQAMARPELFMDALTREKRRLGAMG